MLHRARQARLQVQSVPNPPGRTVPTPDPFLPATGVDHIPDTDGVMSHCSVFDLVPSLCFEVVVDFRIKLSERSAGDAAEEIGEG